MDNKKRESILKKVQEFFSSNDIDAEVVDKSTEVEKFETVLLVDGVTEVTVEPAVEAGAAIVLTAEDGTPVPAPVGEYELQDGRVLVVAEDGVLAEVKEMEAPEEEPMATDNPDNAEKVKRIIERNETEKQYSKQIQDLQKEFSEFKKAKEDEVKFLKEENEALTVSFNDLKTFTKETLETLLGEPSKEPVVKKKQSFSEMGLGESEDILDKFLKANKNG